jgi:hypothetical protein
VVRALSLRLLGGCAGALFSRFANKLSFVWRSTLFINARPVRQEKTKKQKTMTDASFCFSVKWAGSNMKIASLLISATNPVEVNSIQLQEQVGALANIDPQNIKILLGSPAGPQLTPVLFTSALVRAHTKMEEMEAHKAMVAAWSSLTTDRVYNVVVTQHSPVDLAVDLMAHIFRRRHLQLCQMYAYVNLPITLRRNPVVALAALDLYLCDLVYVCLPDELRNNKKFAIVAISRRQAPYSLLCCFSSTLRDDEEVVLKAVARNADNMYHASKRLLNCKTFVLKAVSVNGLCICAAPAFKSDKDVALAAVRQNKAALEYLCDALKADKDIQQVCKTAHTGTDNI